jgi:hypothetical protein
MYSIKYVHKVTPNVYVLQNDLNQEKLSAYLIGEYRVLWLRLSQLASETGKKFSQHRDNISHVCFQQEFFK